MLFLSGILHALTYWYIQSEAEKAAQEEAASGSGSKYLRFAPKMKIE